VPGRAAQQEPEHLGDDIVGQAAGFQGRRNAPSDPEKVGPGLPRERIAGIRISGEEADDEARYPGTPILGRIRQTKPSLPLQRMMLSRCGDKGVMAAHGRARTSFIFYYPAGSRLSAGK
jgi:hypothetical protein